METDDRVTPNLGQAFLFQVPYLIAIFLFTFTNLKKFFANLLRNIANLLSQLKTLHLLNVPHFLLEIPHFLLEIHVTCMLRLQFPISYTLVSFTVKHYFCM